MDVARAVSTVLHPVPVSLATSFLATVMMWQAGITKWVLTALGIILVPLTAIYLWRGKEFFTARENRKTIYLTGILLAVVYTSATYILSAPSEVVRLSVSVLLTGTVFAALNIRTKVSVHTGVISGSATVLTGLENGAVICFLLVPLVGWSRLRLDRHERLQVAAGALIPPAVFLGIYLLGSS